jgi:hypothetical protein
MSQTVKIEAFFSVPPCSGGISLLRLLEEIKSEYGERIDLKIFRGPGPRLEELKISSLPAVVIGDLVRIMGVCPSRETLINALQECGLID